MAFSDSWLNKWEIDINANSVISSNVTDWLCLITELQIPSPAFDIMQSNAEDLRFSSDSNGDTELYYDLVRIDTTAKTAHIYVRIPLLSSLNATTIYAWVGNNSASAHSSAWMQGAYDATWSAWWAMQEGSGIIINDRTGNSHTGALQTGTSWSWDVTESLYGVTFDGTSGHIIVPSDPSLTNSEMTICTYLKLSSRDHDFFCIANKKNPYDDTNGFYVEWNDLSNLWWGRGSGDDDIRYSNSPIVGEWYTPIYRFNNTIGNVWLNGDKGADGTIQSVVDNILDLYIGSWQGGTTSHFEGTIGNIAIANEALTSDQIQLYTLMFSDSATWASAGSLNGIALSYAGDIDVYQEIDINYNSDLLLQTKKDVDYNSDIDIKGTIDTFHSSDIKKIRYSLTWGTNNDAQHGNLDFAGNSSTNNTEIVYDKNPNQGDIMLEEE
jgi:hypothetical protein